MLDYVIHTDFFSFSLSSFSSSASSSASPRVSSSSSFSSSTSTSSSFFSSVSFSTYSSSSFPFVSSSFFGSVCSCFFSSASSSFPPPLLLYLVPLLALAQPIPLLIRDPSLLPLRLSPDLLVVILTQFLHLHSVYRLHFIAH